MSESIIAKKTIEILKGGPGSGSWESPGSPRFSRQGGKKNEKEEKKSSLFGSLEGNTASKREAVMNKISQVVKGKIIDIGDSEIDGKKAKNTQASIVTKMSEKEAISIFKKEGFKKEKDSGYYTKESWSVNIKGDYGFKFADERDMPTGIRLLYTS